MSSSVYQKLEKPARIMFVAPLLLFIEIVSFFLLLIITKEPVLGIACFVPLHLFSVRLTDREPHINNILRFYFERLINDSSGKRPKNKTPMIIKDEETVFYYDI